MLTPEYRQQPQGYLKGHKPFKSEKRPEYAPDLSCLVGFGFFRALPIGCLNQTFPGKVGSAEPVSALLCCFIFV